VKDSTTCFALLQSKCEGMRSNTPETLRVKSFRFEDPWETVDKPDELLARLTQEIVEGHPLHQNLVRVLATRVDSDDLLVETKHGYALVHPTWCRRSRPALPFPHTVLYEDWEDFLESIYKPEREQWLRNFSDDGWDTILPH